MRPGWLGTIVLAAALAAACGGAGAPAGETGAPAAASASADASGGLTRESFVLCPALEPHRDELATLVGFKQNPDRALAVSRSECVIGGQGGDFARVKLLPALVPSIQLHAQGSFDAPASPAPELGADAMFVDAGTLSVLRLELTQQHRG